MAHIRIRPFRPADRDACLSIFDGNVPRFFAADERAEFADYLDLARDASFPTPPYLVMMRGGRIVGCGGIGMAGDTATLDWGMVAADCHGTGLGRRLTEARLAMAVQAGARIVRLATSQHTQGFYARLGFVPHRVTPDGFGPGLDRIDMEWTAPGPRRARNYPALRHAVAQHSCAATAKGLPQGQPRRGDSGA